MSKIPRNHLALIVRQRNGGPMKDRRAPRGGQRNEQRELLEELEEETVAIIANFDVRSLRPGDRVQAADIPQGITSPHPQKGEIGVCFYEADHYGDGNGPMVRFMNGGVCNVYEGWVEEVS